MAERRPPRLTEYFTESPIFFVTFNTSAREPVLANDLVHEELKRYAEGARERGVWLGRYVIMPDHVHLFVTGAHLDLGQWVRGLRRAIGKSLGRAQLWQQGFFDHTLRGSESYTEKWLYVRDNPVRAGLVTAWDEWPYQGEFSPIRY